MHNLCAKEFYGIIEDMQLLVVLQYFTTKW